MNITKFIDSSGYTALHMAVYKNSFKMARFLCNYIKECQAINEEERPRLLERWVNKQTIGDEGFTPLHFASFHGNLELVRYLLNLGGQLNSANKHSINLMHVAA
mmetsp:Transcript_43317/g.41728  ORF Transcript_43317/g.41728 Transcript_43317/m.41728 type:complete len:104 (-) Transcript_43317:1390-1701(-)